MTFFIIKDVDLFPSNKIRLQNTCLYTLQIHIICHTINAIQLLLCNSSYMHMHLYRKKWSWKDHPLALIFQFFNLIILLYKEKEKFKVTKNKFKRKKLKKYFITFTYLLLCCTSVNMWMYRGQRTTCGSEFSPLIM